MLDHRKRVAHHCFVQTFRVPEFTRLGVPQPTCYHESDKCGGSRQRCCVDVRENVGLSDQAAQAFGEGERKRYQAYEYGRDFQSEATLHKYFTLYDA